MARNQAVVRARPEDVFRVLSDGKRYADWVVGAKRIRRTDPAFPKKGTRLHHSVGGPGVTIDDSTKVLDVDAPHRLVLEARVRPVGRALVELVVEPHRRGSLVRMHERVLHVPGVLNRVLAPLIGVRNAESLRRLRAIAEAEGSSRRKRRKG